MTNDSRVRCRLRDLMAARRITSLSQVSQEAGISYPRIMSLYHDKAQAVTLSIVERLCDYFACTPGDLLVLEPAPVVAVHAPGEIVLVP